MKNSRHFGGLILVKSSTKQIVVLTAFILAGWAWYEHVLSNQEDSANSDLETIDTKTPATTPGAQNPAAANANYQAPSIDPSLTTSGTISEAQALIDGGNLQDGAQILEEIARQDPGNTQALMELAMVYTLDFKDPAKARTLLERVIDINPNHRAALNELELVYKELGAIEDGIALLQLKAQQYPDSLELRFAYGRLLAEKDPAAAIPSLEQATKIPDLREDAYDQLAVAALKAGQVELAIKSWNKALALAENELEQAKLKNEPGMDFLEERIASTKTELAKARAGSIKQ